MTPSQRRKAHARVLAAALDGDVPPVLTEATERPTEAALLREIEKYRRVIGALKNCRDPKCSLCARCVSAVWITGSQKASKPYRRKG